MRTNTEGVAESSFKEHLDSVPDRKGLNTENELLLKQFEELEKYRSERDMATS